jgi:hypothetical protein
MLFGTPVSIKNSILIAQTLDRFELMRTDGYGVLYFRQVVDTSRSQRVLIRQTALMPKI